MASSIKKENWRLIIIFGSLMIIASILVIIFAVTRTKIVYMGVHGSDNQYDTVKILDNGDVLCDSNSGESYHKENWKLIKKLSSKELDEFRNIMLYRPNDEVIRYIRDTYGCINAYKD